MPQPSVPTDEAELDELLSRPAPGVLETLDRLDGDVLVLGVAGKMGPTLARMARRAFDTLGKKQRVLGAARFSDPAAEERLRSAGVEILRCDLLDREAVERLPDAPNVVYMAGQKFGTTGAPETTWAMNAYMPALAAQRFARSRIVAFSTGCVYANVPAASGGSVEEDPLEPLGEYANSCVARERLFEYFAKRSETPLVLFRLNYALDLRYGVLLDVARKVQNGVPIDITMGYVNVIWQGDACAAALQCLAYASVPPFVLNVTGPETVSVRYLARRFGALLGCEPILRGREAETALLSNAGRARRLFGSPTAPLEQMIAWQAEWLKQGGRTLDKPTHFETRDGRF
jgi:nucleoside-diphosphate-sugar epimerase